MSETTEAVVEAEAPVETPDPAAIETPDAPQAETTETEQEQPDQPKPEKRGDRRFAHLTARAASLEQMLADERRKREAAEALLQSRQEPTEQTRTAEDPHVIAARMLAEREFETKRASVIAAGTQEFGADAWNEKTGLLHTLGATQNANFMEALVELPNASKVVATLADDPDALVTLLNKTPRAMAAELGRMSAKLESPAAPVAKPVSNAPRPPAAVKPVSTPPEPSIYDKNLSMAEYVALRQKQKAAARR